MKRVVYFILLLMVCAWPAAAQVNIPTPTNVVATSSVAGNTTYIYAVVASDGANYSVYGLSNTLATGPVFSSLGATPNSVTCTAVAGAVKYAWYRVTGSVGIFGKFASTSGCSVTDTGAPGDGSAPWSLANAGISAWSFENAIWLDGCNVYATTPKYPCTGPGLQQAVNDAHGFAGVTNVVMVPETAQIPGSILGAINGYNTTIEMPSGVCVIGAGPNASFYDAQVGVVAFDFPAGTSNSCLINLAVELDNTDANGVAVSFEATASASTKNNKIINFTCYNNPSYGYPAGETCLQFNSSVASNSGNGIFANLFQNITIQNMTEPVNFVGSGCGGHACNDFANVFDNVVVSGGWGPNTAAFNGYFQGDTINAYLHGVPANGRTGISLLNGSRGNHVKFFCDLAPSEMACINDVAGFNFIDIVNANGTTLSTGIGITGDVLTDVEWNNQFTSFQTQRLTLGNPVVVSALPPASANPGMIMRVSDSTAIAQEGQACVGNSSGVAIAISNGHTWKCF